MKTLAALPRFTVAMSLAALPAAAFAQAAPVAQPELTEIEVLAKRVNARNRVDAPAPTLSYDEDYFQRFEPLSVGDMMKRVPGVSFQSDIGEYAEPSLRGIGTEYTQVLVNGRRITGGTNDNTVRRRPHPRRAGRAHRDHPQPVSGHRQPGHRRHAQHHPEGRRRTHRRRLPPGRLLDRRGDEPERVPVLRRRQRRIDWNTSLNYQERFNRKAATELERALDGEGGVEPAFAAVVEDPDERETTDLAWTGDLRKTLGEADEWRVSAFYMDTDRAETEIGREFEAEDDDGEFEAEARAGQPARRVPRDELRRVHRLRARLRRRAFLGDRARLRPDGLRVRPRPTGRTTSTSTSTPRASTDADDILPFLDQSEQGHHQHFRRGAAPGRASCASTEFLDERREHRRRRLAADPQVPRTSSSAVPA